MSHYKINCRECWNTHSTAFDCTLESFRLLTTDGQPNLAGREEMKRRMAAAYARAAGDENAKRFADGFHWAQKHGVPYLALKALREGPEDSTALTAARAFIRDSEKLCLLLVGPTGVGKTLAASLVALDFCNRWPWNSQPTGVEHSPLHFTDAAPLARLSAFDHDSKRQLQDLKDTRLLVLEDAGDEGTDFGRGLLVELLMHRHATLKRTVVTSNLTREGFKARYGEAVADRIRTSGLVPTLSGEKSRRRVA